MFDVFVLRVCVGEGGRWREGERGEGGRGRGRGRKREGEKGRGRGGGACFEKVNKHDGAFL